MKSYVASMTTPSCELCDAIAREAFRAVAMNDHAVTLVCKQPLVPTHVMVLPRMHCTDLSTLEPKAAAGFLSLLEATKRRVAVVAGQDVLVVQNSGVHANQLHVHYHVVPSKKAFRTLMSETHGMPARPDVSDEEMTRYAEVIRSVEA